MKLNLKDTVMYYENLGMSTYANRLDIYFGNKSIHKYRK